MELTPIQRDILYYLVERKTNTTFSSYLNSRATDILPEKYDKWYKESFKAFRYLRYHHYLKVSRPVFTSPAIITDKGLASLK